MSIIYFNVGSTHLLSLLPVDQQPFPENDKMLQKPRIIWVATRDSLWFIPAVLTTLAAGLALGLVRLDATYNIDLFDGGHWLMGGSVDGAREILSTIAGSIITVTGVVFSITIVALQLASTQFTPRVLRNFLADRSNQAVLGVFIATFTYTLLVLRVVRSMGDDEAFVPELSVAVSILFALISIGFLIHFIHHAARSVQAGVILDRVTQEALGKLKQLFPEEVGRGEALATSEANPPTTNAEIVRAKHEGYLQAVDAKSLFELGQRHELLIHMTPAMGAFVANGMPLAEVWSANVLDEDSVERIRNAFVLGSERSPEQDLEFFLMEIADIAIKALSPSINDPTTAKHCIDRLMQILLALGKRDAPTPLRTKAGRVHFVARPSTFDSCVHLSFDQILHFGKDNPEIVKKLHVTVETLQNHLPAKRHPPLRNLLATIKGI